MQDSCPLDLLEHQGEAAAQEGVSSPPRPPPKVGTRASQCGGQRASSAVRP